jgi:hypothetical protein
MRNIWLNMDIDFMDEQDRIGSAIFRNNFAHILGVGNSILFYDSQPVLVRLSVESAFPASILGP